MKKTTYKICSEESGERLDSFIAGKSGLSRSYVQKIIRRGFIAVNAKKEKVSYKVKNNDSIDLTIPEETANSLVPEDIPLDVLYEDEHIIVINKPPQMIVHPAAGNKSGTLINALLFRCGKLASIGAPLRPGVVHRLDKDTSGIIVVAKDDTAYLNLCRQFRERKIEKNYIALIYGNPKKDRGEISAAIGRAVADRKKMSTKTKKGREAITRFEVVQWLRTAALVKVRLITGRTHQIRVHFSASGHPVLGDKIYGKKTSIKSAQRTIYFNRQMLHAYNLKFKHPVNEQFMELTAPIPEDMKKAVKELGGEPALL